MKATPIKFRVAHHLLFCILMATGLMLISPLTSSAQNSNNAPPAKKSTDQTVAPDANTTKATPSTEIATNPSPADTEATKQTTTGSTQQNSSLTTNADISSVKVIGVSGNLALFNTITVTIDRLPELLKAAGNDYSKIILYLDGYPLKGIIPRQGNGSNELKFDLKRTDDEDTKKSWNSLLGRPTLPVPKQKSVSVTVGLVGRSPLETTVKGYPMTVINLIGYWIFAGVLALSLVLFIWWARRSDLLRVGPAFKNSTGQLQLQRYSLGRCQMAYWFILVAASYVFIWMVTSEYGVLPGSVLALIGISAATALGAVIIDTSGPGSLTASVTPQPSDGFFHDIFSDDDGKIAFHRFQIFVWSIVMGVIFLASVYNVLTMPDFPEGLLALMGISSGTYLGFKFPEKQDAQNRAAAGVSPPAPPTP